MQKKIIYIFAFTALSVGFVFSQVKQGDKYFQNGQYLDAIAAYKKDAKPNNPNRQEAYIKMGNSYKAINDYAKAEKAYESAYAVSPDLTPEFHLNYAQILKSQNKYPQAVEQYAAYIKLKPDDESAKNSLKFCQDIQNITTKPSEYTVINVKGLNTSKSEICPELWNDKLLYTAEKEDLDLSDNSANNGEPFLNIYIADINGPTASKSKKFIKSLNAAYHEGPACLSSDGNTMYFTRTVKVKGKSSVYNAKLFVIKRDEKGWGKILPFQYNANEFSTAHPSLSEDNSTLFFTSDMPGGYGGKDIWMCTRKDSATWDKPVNLGPDINTGGNEMFPTAGFKGILYFSSNGLPGFGGLDIYSAKLVDSKWTLIRNEGLSLNSSTDDFGITQDNDTSGYFTSDREGGKGKDDIYWYRFTDKSLIVSGTVLLTEDVNDFAKQKRVKLLDPNGNVVDSTRTNDRGYFEFKNLASDKKYMAVIEEDDPALMNKARYYLTENDSVVQKVTNKAGANRFAFKNLPLDPNALPDLYTDDDLVFAGNLLFGNNPTTALKNTRLKLIGEHGDVIEETTTNEFGAFAFRNIPSDQNYVVSVEESDIDLPEGTKVVLTNKVGKEIQSFYTGANKFSFKILSSEKTVLQDMDAEDVNLVMDMYGTMYNQDKLPIANLKVVIKENGNVIQQLVTTDRGKFSFKNLSVEKNYLFETEENDPALEGVTKIFIADNKGIIYKILEIVNGKFSFHVLEVDKTMLGEFVVDDPWLKVAELKNPKQFSTKTPAPAVVSKKKNKKAPEPTPHVEEQEEESELTVTIIQNIYYAYGDYSLDLAAQTIMNKAVDVLVENPAFVMEIKSHTDSQSSASFNMQLSKKRANTAVEYLVSKGISRSRLKATGYGETKLLNRCADGVGCTDEEHQMNRRTEFKITKPIKH